MNKRRLKKLADTLRDGTFKDMPGFVFDMEYGLYPRSQLDGGGCGTAGCVAGLAVVLFDKDNVRVSNVYGDVIYEWLPAHGRASCSLRDPMFQKAAEVLGLTMTEADTLFFPMEHGGPRRPAPSLAADVIDDFVATGVVNWGHPDDDEDEDQL